MRCLVMLSSIIFTLVAGVGSSLAQCIFNGQQYVYQYPNGMWGPCPVRPILPNNPPPIMPYPDHEQHNSSFFTSKVYDSTCFNVRTHGGFLSKTLRELVESREAKAIGTAICTYYSGQPAACVRVAEMGADISNNLTRHAGGESWGVIRARPGYEVCRVFWDEADWSVTGGSTFSAQLALDSVTMGIQVSFYTSMRVGTNRGNWIDTKVILEQVPKGTRDLNQCWPDLTHAWVCRGAACSTEQPGARVKLGRSVGNRLCIDH